MKFERVDLIKRLRAEIERRDQLAAERRAEQLVSRDQELTRHVEGYAEHWNAFANTIKRRIRRGEPITREDVPENLVARSGYRSRGELPYWERGKLSADLPNHDQFSALIAVLEASTDEYVTSSAIEAMGIKLNGLFR